MSSSNGSPLKYVLRAALFGDVDPDDPDCIDPKLIEYIVDPVGWVGKTYFRAEVRGLSRVPEGPALVVGNHNAGITFLEPFFMCAAYYKRLGTGSPIHALAHDAMVDFPFLQKFLVRCGAIRASHENATKVLANGHKLAVYPGGNKEAFRKFTDRHQIDLAGRTGFIKLALRAGVPIVPEVQIGGHETFFVLSPGERLAKLLRLPKLLRSDTCALTLGLPFGVTLGPMFHLPLPSKSVIEFGAPIDLKELGYTADDVADREKLGEIYDLVSSVMQGIMDRLAAERRFPILG
jgi:1-acyl-sn-glycerol-3-phosphate acyltransferase